MSGNFAIKGGGVGPLMANAILNFHFDFLNPSLRYFPDWNKMRNGWKLENSSQDDLDHFWLRVNHSPDRGTLILNRGNLWSGGLGDYRFQSPVHYYQFELTLCLFLGSFEFFKSNRHSDNALLRWSAICVAIDFGRCWVTYWIDGRQVADEPLVKCNEID